MQKAIICEIDGVLSDNRHRLHFIEPTVDEITGMCAKPQEDGSLKWTRRGPDYDAYHAAASEDGVNEVMSDLLDAPAVKRFGDARILFVTGRPEKYRTHAWDWLKENILPSQNFDSESYQLFMRPDYFPNPESDEWKEKIGKPGLYEYGINILPDLRPTHIIKHEIYEREIKGKYDVLFVLEKDEACCKMYRELGLQVLRVM